MKCSNYSLDFTRFTEGGNNNHTMDFIMWNLMEKWEEWKMRNGASFEVKWQNSFVG